MEFNRQDTKMLKGIAIILMLYHHLFAFPERIAQDISYIPIFPSVGQFGSAYHLAWAGKLCVAIFCFLGGYGTYISCIKKHDKEDKQRVILKKIKGLYKIFWSVFIIFIPLCMFAGIDRVTKDISSLVLNFVALNTTYNGEWWFITSYLILLCVYALFSGLIERKRGCLIEVSSVIALDIVIRFVVSGIVGLPFLSQLANSWQWIKFYAAISLLPPFLIGCIFAKYDLLGRLKAYTYGKKTLIVVAYIVIFVILYFRTKVNVEYDYVLVPFFVGGILIILQGKMWTGLRYVLEKIGNESTYIWLIHSFYCYMLCQDIVYYPRVSVFIVVWLIILSYITAKIIKLLISLVEKLVRKIDNVN